MKFAHSVDYTVANEKDDDAIGRFFSRIPMKGAVRISFERKPSFLKAASHGNSLVQTVVGKDKSTGDIIGIGTRAIRKAFINGKPVDIGYLGSLRLEENRRGSVFLSGGYQFLRQLHEDNRVKAYISTVVEDNHEALAVLTSGRAGLPTYQDLGGLFTCVLNTKNSPEREADEIRTVQATENDRERIIEFIDRIGRDRQFFPADASNLNGFAIQDYILALHDGDIVGCSALYDARQEKQIIIRNYSNQALLMRYLWNAFVNPLGWPAWPPVGTDLSYAFSSLLTLDLSQPQALFALIRALRLKAQSRGLEYLMIGFHERDPLWELFRKRYRYIRIKSRLFLVYWDDGKSWAANLDSRPPFIELSSL